MLLLMYDLGDEQERKDCDLIVMCLSVKIMWSHLCWKVL